MGNLEFEAAGDWKLQGDKKKELYISLVAKIDDWKKNVIFYRSRVEEEAFGFLLQSILRHEDFTNWKFSVSTQGGYMNSIYVSQVFSIADKAGKIIFAGKEAKY